METRTADPTSAQDYGLLDLAQGGFRSKACVTDDGRVDIIIREGSRDFSNVLTRKLEEQQSKAPPKATKRSVQANIENPLRLNIVIQVVGSRGDVQPFIALGQVLKQQFRHRVRIATHPVFQKFVEEYGLEFFSLGGDPAELMAFMVKNPGLMPGNDALKQGQIGQRRKAMLEVMQRCWRSCFEGGTGSEGSISPDSTCAPRSAVPFIADAIIANPPSFGHIHCAERMGIPVHIMFTMPWTPTQAFPHPLSNIQSTDADLGLTNFLTYSLVELLTWQGLGDLINQFREITLGLPSLTVISGPGINSRLKLPHTYCWSPALVPKPQDWGNHISCAGFYFLAHSDSYAPPQDLQNFLDSGPAPVYIGFGSIVVDSPDAMTRMIFEAVEKSGQRALVSKGWGGLGAAGLSKPDAVFMLANVPHDWLFPRVSCVVHHGGAGTTAAGIAAGKPTIIVPFFGDQPFWGNMVAKAGAGPSPIPHKVLTADKLAEAIKFALTPAVARKAKDMARKIASENGAVNGASEFHQALDMRNLECSLLPSQKAAWRVKGTDVKVSPLAASTLMKEQAITVEQLELYRTKEYHSSQGPWEPLTGGASALLGTIGTLMGGLTDIPTDVFRHIGRAFGGTTGDGNDGAATDKAVIDKRDVPGVEANDQSAQVAHLEPLTFEAGLDAGKGAARAIGAGLKSPMDFTLALAKGFRNAPKLYGDKTVRKTPEVTGFSSGVKTATMELGQGFYDGISGLFRHPAVGAREEGFEGFVKGFGKAIGGIVLKPAAGIWGVPGYLSEGVWQELRRRITMRSDAEIIAGRVLEGEQALHDASRRDRDTVVEQWHNLIASGLRLPNASDHPEGSQLDRTNTFQDEGNGKSEHAQQQHDLVQDNVDAAVDVSSRGNADEDALIRRAIEASLNNAGARYDGGQMASSQLPSRARYDSEASFRNDLPANEIINSDDKLSSAIRDDASIASDEDENIKRALEESRRN